MLDLLMGVGYLTININQWTSINILVNKMLLLYYFFKNLLKLLLSDESTREGEVGGR